MNSTVLARKYRPKGFDTMVGQGHVVQALGNALTQQRLHHAYLFTGTRGVGKTTVSRILAKSLNCVGPDGQGTITASPCGQCQPCRDIDAGRFVDYVELDAASNRGVEEISQLLEQAVYKPVVGRFKVYMIDEVHMLSNTAFNAMLKTLEEPPEYLKFVLATTDPQKVPVTVLSRCLQFNLRPMAVQTVEAHLAQVLAIENIPADGGSLRLIARAARGSMRDAMSLADQAIAFGSGQLEESAVRQMLGAVDRQHVQRIIEAVAAGDGAGLIEAVDILRGLGLSASGTLEELATALQRMAVCQAVPHAVTSDDPDEATWQALAPKLAPDETQLFYSLCLQGRAELALAPDEYNGLLMLLLRLLAFKPGHTFSSAGGGAPPKAEGSALTIRAEPQVVSPAPVFASISASVPSRAAATPASTVSSVVATTPVPVAPMPAPEPRSAAPVNTPASVPPWEALPAEANENWDAEPDSSEVSEPAHFAEDPAYETITATWQEPEAVSAPEPNVAIKGPSIDLPPPGSDPLSDRWSELVAQLQERGLISALVRELAIQAQCTGQHADGEQSAWQLMVERESLRTDTLKERLAQAMSTLLGQSVQLEITRGVAHNTPAQRDLVARELRQMRAEALISNDPMVQRFIQQYPGARLVPGSIQPIASKTAA